jgi:hypothetical protein
MTHIFTLLYNNAKVLRRSFTQLQKTVTGDYKIIALDNHYPLITDRQKAAIVKKFDITVHDSGKNLGLHEGYNTLLKQYPDVDKVILFDCDSMPKRKGWNEMMVDVLGYPNIAYCCLENEVANREMLERGYRYWRQKDHIFLQPHKPCVMSITATTQTFLNKVGGLQEPNKYYGGLEAAMWKYFNETEKMVYIKGVDEIRIEGNLKDLQDPQYREYKWKHAHEGYKHSFNTFLSESNKK